MPAKRLECLPVKTFDQLSVIGLREWIAFPELGMVGLRAKIDTGASTSSLHASDIVPFERDGEKWVRFTAHLGTLVQRREFDNNLVWRVAVPPDFRKYVFAKGYIAIHGASLTVAEVNRAEGWFEVWLIPETRRATVFEDKRAGDVLNIEIERSTQVVVDTVREAVHESLGRLQPVLEALLKEKGLSLDDFVQAPVLPH